MTNFVELSTVNCEPLTKIRNPTKGGVSNFTPGSDLLSHLVTKAVPSTQRGLTSVFGMGTGVSPSLLPPENFLFKKILVDGSWFRVRSPLTPTSINQNLWFCHKP
jgi:hypothetical protein